MPADRRLRVLQVIPDTTGGIGAHVRMLTEELIRLGHDVCVAGPRETLDRFAIAGLGARTAPVAAGSLRHSFRVRAAVRDLAARHDLTHAHGVRAGAQAAVSAQRPLVVTWHNAPLGGRTRRTLHAGLEQVSARRSDVVLGASADLVERARRAGARDARLCELPAPARAGAPAVVGEQRLHHPPTVVAVARLHRQKRLDLLIDAAAAWRDRDDAPQVLIAGDGPLAAQLRRRAVEAGAPVRFLGPVSDVGALLDAADVVVLPSDWEARPFVAQEALRAGVPLVATDVGGVGDLVREAAVLVPPGDPQALRRGVEAVLGDDGLRRRLRAAGPARAAQWATPAEMAHGIAMIYLEVTSRSSAARA